jgi:RimJ/RimL family protein N-acetyltransferase
VGALHPAVAAPLRAAVTSRLSVTPLSEDDIDELAAVFARREVWEFEYGRGLTRTETTAFLERQMRLWAECGFGGCAVRLRDARDLIGVVGLALATVAHRRLPSITVGWRFSPTAWGIGYATEAATAVLDQAFTAMRVQRVGCVTNAENRRSVALAERLGMTAIATTAVPRDDGTGNVSALLLQLSRSEWHVRRPADGPGLA